MKPVIKLLENNVNFKNFYKKYFLQFFVNLTYLSALFGFVFHSTSQNCLRFEMQSLAFIGDILCSKMLDYTNEIIVES